MKLESYDRTRGVLGMKLAVKLQITTFMPTSCRTSHHIIRTLALFHFSIFLRVLTIRKLIFDVEFYDRFIGYIEIKYLCPSCWPESLLNDDVKLSKII